MTRSARGFTLIELLVVVSIVAILASIVLASLSNSRTKGENAAMVRQVEEYITAINLSYVPNGNSFPTYGGTLRGCLVSTFSISGIEYCNFGGNERAYPDAQRDAIGEHISLVETISMSSNSGTSYDSVVYASDANGSSFTLYYPIKNSTDCALDDAAPFGASDGNITVCQYTAD